jgi:hypothetical protein
MPVDAITWIAEQRIQEAAAQGAFDDLPGRGKPLILEDDAHVPPELRMAYKVLRNAGYVPDEVAERKEAESLLELLAHCPDEREKLRQMRRLDVLLARIEQRRGHAVSLPGNAYHAKLAERLG